MRLRRPRFALVLTALVAAAAVAILLSGRKAGNSTPKQPQAVGAGPPQACLSTKAAAQFTAHSGIVITATAAAPLTVTEEASGPKGTAVVSRSEVLAARVRATQPVAVRRTAVVSARGCGSGVSLMAARTIALRRAYAGALAAARASSARGAAQALRSEIRTLYPSVLARARASAGSRAHELALAARPALAAQAHAQALKEAGG